MKPQIDTDIKSHMINKMLENDQFRTSHHSKANSIDLDCPSAQIHKAMKSKSFIKTSKQRSSKSRSKSKKAKKKPLTTKNYSKPNITVDFIARNKRWLQKKKNKQKKIKEIEDQKKLQECTFKPKTLAKEFTKKKKTEKLRSKISKSLSPQKIKISDHFDLSVMKKARMRVEHAGEQEKFIMDQISPTNIPPSGFKNNSEEIKEEYEESVSGSKTDEEFYQIDMLKSDLKSDTVTLNLSKSPRIQHQILNKNDDTISASKDPNEGQKLGELPAAKRLIFNSKNQEHRGDEGADSSPPQSFAALVRGKENAIPNNGLINNKNRAEIFNTMPVLKENSTLSVSVMESEKKTPNKLVENQEVILVEVEDSGFDDFKSFEDQKDFDEYKKEDFNNYLNLKREEDSFDYESELSIPIENVDGHF